MVAISQQPQKMTIEEYLAWEPQQDLRYEYVNGEVFAMTGGTIPHNDIALNLHTALRPHLRARGCRVNVSDVKVQLTPQSPYYYPDVIVSCDPQDLNYCRGEGRMWLYYPYIEGDIITLSSIEFEFAIALLYEGVVLGAEAE